ncbi:MULTISPECIES: hypothetical protein [Amycolatopsis]|uniref:hypothetical protein n=1 Tax=Amycolatopsis TaxID=1813 RepID=UPI000B8B62A1|nr:MULTISPECIES: hypothetical protein [Amycolatopsis]OXM73074.1 hypothetical protein CF166_11160 [Amycolatopsis sp. KNN50.9b]
MTDLHEIPFEQRTADLVRSHYHALFPLLRAYDEITREHNSGHDDINEPWEGGLDTLQITALALQRVGKPPRDRDDVLHAECHINRLQEEMLRQYPAQSPTLAEAIISVEFAWAGCVTKAEDFEQMSEDDKREHVDGLVEELRGDMGAHLRDALLIALPTIYRQITADNEAWHRKARLEVAR